MVLSNLLALIKKYAYHTVIFSISLLIITIPKSYRVNTLDSDMVPMPEYIYTSTICEYDSGTGLVGLNMRGKSIIGKQITLVGYINVRDDGQAFITNMPGVVNQDSLRYLNVIEIPIILSLDNINLPTSNLVIVALNGTLNYIADNDFEFHVQSFSDMEIIVPRHVVEYLLFSQKYYHAITECIENYYSIIENSEEVQKYDNIVSDAVIQLQQITYENTETLELILKELRGTVVRPEIIDKNIISRSAQLENIQIVFVEELIRWGSLQGEKLLFKK